MISSGFSETKSCFAHNMLQQDTTLYLLEYGLNRQGKKGLIKIENSFQAVANSFYTTLL